MIVRILLEGKVRDKNCEAFIAEYRKRLSPFFSFEIAEAGTGNSKMLEKLIKNSCADDFFIGFDALGKKYDSLSFAEWFNSMRIKAKSINFIIGEAEGLSDMARSCVSSFISLSDLTFSYRVSLMAASEQIYRAMMIISGHPYHK